MPGDLISRLLPLVACRGPNRRPSIDQQIMVSGHRFAIELERAGQVGGNGQIEVPMRQHGSDRAPGFGGETWGRGGTIAHRICAHEIAPAAKTGLLVGRETADRVCVPPFRCRDTRTRPIRCITRVEGTMSSFAAVDVLPPHVPDLMG